MYVWKNVRERKKKRKRKREVACIVLKRKERKPFACDK